ncbi:MAG TPA: glycine cleavage system protein GcvH [Polyangiaceae bacterium]|nr:glycine cleavage system protein GcvH [Polyangiaceae bacterium]
MTEVQTYADRRYTKDHEWAKPEGDEVLIGITAFAVEQLGDITLVNFDVKVGDEVEAGKMFGTIESVKTLSDLFAPISGQVTRINEDLEHQPELINDDPWKLGWMIAVKPSQPAEQASLMDAAAYATHAATSDH